MSLKTNKNTLISIGLSFILTGIFTWGTPYDTKGLSPYYSAAAKFEDKVFQKIRKKKELDKLWKQQIQEKKRVQAIIAQKKLEREKENQIKKKIIQLASKYRIKLDPEFVELVPNSIIAESKSHGYDPMFLTAVIITESSFNHRAKSHKGAMGLMQILPKTGYSLASEKQMKWRGKRSLYNPEVNIALGAYYLSKLRKRFGGLHLALEAYNHGPSNLRRFLRKGITPKLYSQKVFNIYKKIDFEPV